MTSCKATVVIPTYHNGPTLKYSVPTALAQTVDDIQIFIVGDGTDDASRALCQQFVAQDSRVRFFDFKKGPRHGELNRHKALQEARGELICNLSDDDLWMPNHIAECLSLIEHADFVHTLPIHVYTDGHVESWVSDLSRTYFRDLLLSGINRVPLPCSAWRLEAYRRLPYGWRTTPPGIHTDLYMFQQFLREPWVRALSGWVPTVLHFPSPERKGLTQEHTLAELKKWSERITQPDFMETFLQQVLSAVALDRAALEARLSPYPWTPPVQGDVQSPAQTSGSVDVAP